MMKHHHGSPFEHVTFKFLVRAPVLVWWNWKRHRIASYNLESSRFHKMSDDFYIPNPFRLQDPKNKQSSAVEFLNDDDNGRMSGKLRLWMDAGWDIYEELLSLGVSNEQARTALPFASVYFTGVFTVNVRSMMNFLSLRNDAHASVEIQEYAKIMEEWFAQMMPLTYDAYKKYFLTRVKMFS